MKNLPDILAWVIFIPIVITVYLITFNLLIITIKDIIKK